MVFRISAPEFIHREARSWMGKVGWLEDDGPGIQVTVDLSADDRLSCSSRLLGSFAGPREWTLSELEFRMASAALKKAHAGAGLHAATLQGPAGGLLIVGPHGAGKTTLALALARAGCTLFGDDICLISDQGSGLALARPLRLKENTTAMLSAQEQRASFYDSVEELVRIDVVDVGGAPPRWLPIRDVVFSSFIPGESSKLEPLSSELALSLLARQCFETRDRSSNLKTLIELIAGARLWSHSTGLPPLEAAHSLLEGMTA